ncbi:MAG: cobaltochelatase subunit CobN, partial [Acidimicrobiia bacterium]|nr:cobaltochelatase subunit CobN [Acidimicrobiia bacterium]
MTVWFLSNADTELLALRSVTDGLPDDFPAVRAANPTAQPGVPDVAAGDAVVVRLLGGRAAWEAPFDALVERCRARSVPLVALGGEAMADAELVAASTVPAGICAEAHRYLVEGGPDNVEHLLRFVVDTTLYGGFGFDPPRAVPAAGIWDHRAARPGSSSLDGRAEPAAGPLVGVIFYRAHLVAGNTGFVADLCDAIEAAGGRAMAVYTYSLRPDADGRVEALDLCRQAGVEALVTTVLASGGSTGADAGADGGWEVPQLASLGVPVLQAPSSNRSRAAWLEDEAGLSPLDATMGVAIPEFDGRIIGPAFAFKEVVDDGDHLGIAVTASRADPERTRRVAELAVRHARLRRVAPTDKRVAIVLSAYPTKRARLGNAVGLDTPASVLALLDRLDAEGYQVRDRPADGDTLMAALADGLHYDRPRLDDGQVVAAPGRWPVEDYTAWFAGLPTDARDQVEAVWGPAPGEVYVHRGALTFPGLELGNVLVTIQPPRGFGSDPIGTYHAPDVPPPHHYLAFYRWLDEGWGADAVVHVGKHGTLEWLPGKGVALSASCFPDAALGGLPLVYPFVVNDPGEGTQAKRRAHAVVVDHLPPPLTRADTYDDLARLEQLLDTYAQVQLLDPAKLPAIRQQVWDCVVDAEIHRDLGLEGGQGPDPDAFDDMVLHVDGYLCALKDAQIRGGLHVLGAAPGGEALVDVVLAVTRLRQGDVASLRAEVAAGLGLGSDAAAGGGGGRFDAGEAADGPWDPTRADRAEVDRVDAAARAAVETLAAAGWQAPADASPTQRWICETLLPALDRTGDELDHAVAALAGRYVPAGPSGAPSRGQANVLPTGRNFYSVDPKALPSALSWEVGTALAEQVVARHLAETGAPPRTVGIVLWGTAAMRT